MHEYENAGTGHGSAPGRPMHLHMIPIAAVAALTSVFLVNVVDTARWTGGSRRRQTQGFDHCRPLSRTRPGLEIGRTRPSQASGLSRTLQILFARLHGSAFWHHGGGGRGRRYISFRERGKLCLCGETPVCKSSPWPFRLGGPLAQQPTSTHHAKHNPPMLLHAAAEEGEFTRHSDARVCPVISHPIGLHTSDGRLPRSRNDGGGWDRNKPDPT